MLDMMCATATLHGQVQRAVSLIAVELRTVLDKDNVFL